MLLLTAELYHCGHAILDVYKNYSTITNMENSKLGVCSLKHIPLCRSSKSLQLSLPELLKAWALCSLCTKTAKFQSYHWPAYFVLVQQNLKATRRNTAVKTRTRNIFFLPFVIK